MDLSGLIFVALALVWGVVLIPKALRAHDDAARTRSVDASSDRARVLPRAGRTPVAPVEVAPQAEVAHNGGGHVQADVQSALARHRRLAAAAARRRRRVMVALLAATAVTAIASSAGVLVPWAAAVPGGLVVAFLALGRLLVRREHAAWERTLRGLRGRGPGEQPSEDTGERQDPMLEPELLVVARNAQGVAVVSDAEDTSSLDAAIRARAVGAPSSTLWDPLPVTLPTYVTKPRASRSVRTIDLGAPDVSSSGHDAADSALVADAGGPGEEQEPPAQRAVGS